MSFLTGCSEHTTAWWFYQFKEISRGKDAEGPGSVCADELTVGNTGEMEPRMFELTETID